MNVVFAPQALLRLEDQLRYLRERNEAASSRLRDRVFDFVDEHLARFPNSGHQINDKLWERWIPGTRLVLWYEIRDEDLLIMTIWHTAQDRGSQTAADED